MEVEKNPADKGTLIISRIKLLPLGPAGPFRVRGTLIAHTADGVEPVGDMTLECDSLPLLEFALVEFRKAVVASLKNLAEEIAAAKAGKPIHVPDAATVRRFQEGKG